MIGIIGRVGVSSGEATVNARVLFAFAPPPTGSAAGDTPREASTVDARGSIVRLSLAQVESAVASLRDQPHPEGLAADELPRRVVEIVYADVDPVLWGAAELSVRAQLAHLAQRG